MRKNIKFDIIQSIRHFHLIYLRIQYLIGKVIILKKNVTKFAQDIQTAFKK